MPYSTAHRRAIREGCLASHRSKSVREHYATIVSILVGIGRADLFHPRLKSSEIEITLQHLAPTFGSDSTQVRAIRDYFDKSRAATDLYFRRNRRWLAAQLDAQKNKGPTPER
jgi:hypothetical protein